MLSRSTAYGHEMKHLLGSIQRIWILETTHMHGNEKGLKGLKCLCYQKTFPVTDLQAE